MTINKTKIQKISTRRTTLKKLLTGTGAVLAVKAAPDEWAKPMVESVVLPSHAQTSSFGFTSLGFASAVNQNGILNILLPRAHAKGGPSTAEKNICINYSGGNAEVQVALSDDPRVYSGSFKLPFTSSQLFVDLVDEGQSIYISGQLSEDGNQIIGEVIVCFGDAVEYTATKSSASCQVVVKTEIKSTPQCLVKKAPPVETKSTN